MVPKLIISDSAFFVFNGYPYYHPHINLESDEHSYKMKKERHKMV